MEICLKSLADKWPSTIVSRDKIADFTGGLISKGTIANLDSEGQGPPKFYLGPRKIGYPIETLIPWLEDRIRKATARRPRAVPRGKRAENGGVL
jgi:predicted DNA-binding transcriptional regulator AlpA